MLNDAQNSIYLYSWKIPQSGDAGAINTKALRIELHKIALDHIKTINIQ